MVVTELRYNIWVLLSSFIDSRNKLVLLAICYRILNNQLLELCSSIETVHLNSLTVCMAKQNVSFTSFLFYLNMELAVQSFYIWFDRARAVDYEKLIFRFWEHFSIEFIFSRKPILFKFWSSFDLKKYFRKLKYRFSWSATYALRNRE